MLQNVLNIIIIIMGMVDMHLQAQFVHMLQDMGIRFLVAAG